MPLTRDEIKRLFLTRAEQAGMASAAAWDRMRYDKFSNNWVDLGLNTLTSAVAGAASGAATGGPPGALIGAGMGASKGFSSSISNADEYGNLPTYNPGASAEQGMQAGLQGNAYVQGYKELKGLQGPTGMSSSGPSNSGMPTGGISGGLDTINSLIPTYNDQGNVTMSPITTKKDPYVISEKAALLNGIASGNPLKGLSDYSEVSIKANKAQEDADQKIKSLEMKNQELELKKRQMDIKAESEAQDQANELGTYSTTLPSGETKTYTRSDVYNKKLLQQQSKNDAQILVQAQKIANAMGTYTAILSDGKQQVIQREPAYAINLTKNQEAISVMKARYNKLQKDMEKSPTGEKLTANGYYNLVSKAIQNATDSGETISLEQAIDRVSNAISQKTPEMMPSSSINKSKVQKMNPKVKVVDNPVKTGQNVKGHDVYIYQGKKGIMINGVFNPVDQLN